MARIRSIKPETWADQKLARLSRDARLLYIALWNFADEQARMVGDPRQIKGLCFALDDDLDPASIDRLLGELVGIRRVMRYEVDGELYLWLPKLACHQRLDKDQASRYPPPPDEWPSPPGNIPPPATADFSGEVRGQSEQVQPRARAYVAGSRLQVAGSKENPLVESAAPFGAPTRPDSIADVRQVFDAWNTSLPPGTQRRLTEPRRKTIGTRLREFGLRDCLDAAVGWRNDPWPGRVDQNDITILFRPGNFEKMRDLARDGPPAQLGRRTRQMLDTARQMRAIGEAKGVSNNGVAGMGADRGPAQRELARPADRAGDGW